VTDPAGIDTLDNLLVLLAGVTDLGEMDRLVRTRIAEKVHQLVVGY
jgi:hypothetical protein